MHKGAHWASPQRAELDAKADAADDLEGLPLAEIIYVEHRAAASG